MRTTTAIAVLAIFILAFAAPAFAQTTVTIPRYTVIPVTLQQTLSSATNQVGDTFSARCSGNCGGFPAGTVFNGRVTSVMKAEGSTPGQIEVRFYQAVLPNNERLSLDGTLTSLNQNDVTTDPNTGRLTQRPEVRNQRSKFIAYGAGLGILIGVLSDGSVLRGALIGALAGYLAGGALGDRVVHGDVNVPAGTEFGIALQQDVRLGAGTGAGTGTGPGTGAGPVTPALTITFDDVRPFRTSGGVVMVPFRYVMNELDQSFVYMPSSRTVLLNTADHQINHRVGSRVVYVDGLSYMMSAPSRNVNGTLFVPWDMIRVITDREVRWQASTGTLIID